MISTAREQLRSAATVPEVDLEKGDLRDYRQKPAIRKAEKRSKSRYNISLPWKFLIFLASFGVFITLWQLTFYFAGNSAILASPIQVINALAGMLELGSSPATQGLQNAYAALFETLEVVAIGLGLSVAAGVPIGLAMGRWKPLEAILEPWVTASNSIPIVVLIPALYFLIGGGLPADAFISFVLSVFSVIINTHAGVRYMNFSFAEVGRTFRADETQFITKIVIPSALPDIFAGVRIAVGRALLGAVMAETLLGANHGLGGIMITYEEILNTPAMMATVVLIALVGIVLLQAPKILERRIFRWREGERISRRIAR